MDLLDLLCGLLGLAIGAGVALCALRGRGTSWWLRAAPGLLGLAVGTQLLSPAVHRWRAEVVFRAFVRERDRLFWGDPEISARFHALEQSGTPEKAIREHRDALIARGIARLPDGELLHRTELLVAGLATLKEHDCARVASGEIRAGRSGAWLAALSSDQRVAFIHIEAAAMQAELLGSPPARQPITPHERRRLLEEARSMVSPLDGDSIERVIHLAAREGEVCSGVQALHKAMARMYGNDRVGLALFLNGGGGPWALSMEAVLPDVSFSERGWVSVSYAESFAVQWIGMSGVRLTRALGGAGVEDMTFAYVETPSSGDVAAFAREAEATAVERLPDYRQLATDPVTCSGHQAIEFVGSYASPAGIPTQRRACYFLRNGHGYVFTYAIPTTRLAEEEPLLMRIRESTWLP